MNILRFILDVPFCIWNGSPQSLFVERFAILRFPTAILNSPTLERQGYKLPAIKWAGSREEVGSSLTSNGQGRPKGCFSLYDFAGVFQAESGKKMNSSTM